MQVRARLRAFGAAALISLLLNACGSAHSVLPSVTDNPVTSERVHAKSIGSVSGDIVAINAGGPAVGGFAADTGYSSGSWTSATNKAIDTSNVTTPGLQAVYQTMRVGKSFTYVISGLSPATPYTVQLSFAEVFWSAPGKRVFNVSANGVNELADFDIVATAGAADTAITKSFGVTTAANGTVTLAFTAVTDNAAVNAIEVIASGATPQPSPAPTALPAGSVLIDAGGTAVGNFVADEDYSPATSWAYTTTSAVTTSAVPNPAPEAVYQSQRVGSAITYTIPGLIAGGSYSVRLDFAELYFKSAGQRVFNVAINGTKVLTNFDIIATAGVADNAVAQTFTTTATAAKTIVIALSAVVNNPVINGLEISPVIGASPTPTPPASPVPSPSGTPIGFNDYSTFGYDNAHDIYNPNSTAISPANLSALHLAWQSKIGDYNTQTQPVLATEIPGHSGMLFVGGGSGKVYGYDALTGALVWKNALGNESVPGCGSGSVAGTGGTVAYDPGSKSLYVVGNSNAVELYHLDAATGTLLGKVNVGPAAIAAGEWEIGHTAVTLNNGVAYVGVGSYCDASPWRGMVVAVKVPSMTVAGQFFTSWDPQNTRGLGAQPWSGGSIWGWGGVTVDASGNVLTGVGNGDDGTNGSIPAPFSAAPHEWSGFGDSLLELSSSLGNVVGFNHPIPVGVFGGNSSDLDVQGTPLVFTPTGSGCGPMVAIQAKAGTLSIYNESSLSSGPLAQYQMAPSAWSDSYLGGPTYSPTTGLIYANVASSTSPSLFPPGLIAVNPGCGAPAVVWNAAFGIDSSNLGVARGVPAASAGGVVFAESAAGAGEAGSDVWAINAGTGSVLNGGTPILTTSGYIRMPATIDGNWVFIIDNSGDLYGLTVNPSVPAIKARSVAVTQAHRWQPKVHD